MYHYEFLCSIVTSSCFSTCPESEPSTLIWCVRIRSVVDFTRRRRRQCAVVHGFERSGSAKLMEKKKSIWKFNALKKQKNYTALHRKGGFLPHWRNRRSKVTTPPTGSDFTLASGVFKISFLLISIISSFFILFTSISLHILRRRVLRL